MEQYVAFLRGINVGGRHKVPMRNLRWELEQLELKNVVTLLNSGNVIFETDEDNLETKISSLLEKNFGFPVPAIIRKSETITNLFENNPFSGIEDTQGVHLYVTFLREDNDNKVQLPWRSPDNSFWIIKKKDRMVYSILYLSVSKDPKAMSTLEKFYGKDITTRNWNTIKRITNKLKVK